MSNDQWSCDDVIRWLVRSGRLTSDPREFVQNLGRALIDAGAPVWRIRIGCRTIHPQIGAWSVLWSEGMARATELRAGHGYEDNDTYLGSPMARIAETGALFRRRLLALEEDRDHSILFTLRGEGATDYVALPLAFSDRTASSLILVTKDQAGFDDADLEGFEALSHHVAPVFEVYASKRIAVTLLDTYVGRRTGERVLAGQIKRGDGERIRAAIWFSDLRGFTPLTESLSSGELLELLNGYFEAVSAAVTARGGEVLRFIGDAMLIVFPVSGAREHACAAALDAARDAFDGIAALNFRRARSARPVIEFGVGLHVGEVIYGNVGAPDRLDFTVMGPAVNRTARLESLTKDVARSLLMSAEFAACIDRPTVSVGAHAFKGVAGRHEVFALADTD